MYIWGVFVELTSLSQANDKVAVIHELEGGGGGGMPATTKILSFLSWTDLGKFPGTELLHLSQL